MGTIYAVTIIWCIALTFFKTAVTPSPLLHLITFGRVWGCYIHIRSWLLQHKKRKMMWAINILCVQKTIHLNHTYLFQPLKRVWPLLSFIRRQTVRCGACGFSIEAGRCVAVLLEKFRFGRVTCWWLRWAHDESNSKSNYAGAADDGRGCPEEVAAI